MDVLKIILNENADVPYIKKIISQIKGVSGIEIQKNEEMFVWEDVEKTEAFNKIIEKSREQLENGEGIEHTKELLDSIFRKK